MGDPARTEAQDLWGKIYGKIHRSPRTLKTLLRPKIKRRAQAIEKRINRRKFATTGASLRRQNPNTEGLVLNTRMVDAIIPSIAYWADWSLTKNGFCGQLGRQPDIIYVRLFLNVWICSCAIISP